jgi:hypothetical protein
MLRYGMDGYIEIKWLYGNEAMLANCTATMKRDDGVKSLSQKFVKPGPLLTSLSCFTSLVERRLHHII